MKALVVYESMWGNTARIAEAVGEGLGGAPVVEVHQASPSMLEGIDLLVVGGPTHAFSMSRRSTRHEAVERGATVGAEDRGLRELLADLPATVGVPVATFDTRVARVRHLPGSAARKAGSELARHHHGRVVDTCSFYVVDVPGPLVAGEEERAAAWGAGLRGNG